MRHTRAPLLPSVYDPGPAGPREQSTTREDRDPQQCSCPRGRSQTTPPFEPGAGPLRAALARGDHPPRRIADRYASRTRSRREPSDAVTTIIGGMDEPVESVDARVVDSVMVAARAPRELGSRRRRERSCTWPLFKDLTHATIAEAARTRRSVPHVNSHNHTQLEAAERLIGGERCRTWMTSSSPCLRLRAAATSSHHRRRAPTSMSACSGRHRESATYLAVRDALRERVDHSNGHRRTSRPGSASRYCDSEPSISRLPPVVLRRPTYTPRRRRRTLRSPIRSPPSNCRGRGGMVSELPRSRTPWKSAGSRSRPPPASR